LSHIPYRITIELAIGERGKTVQVTGETDSLGYASFDDAAVCALAANALVWESSAMANAASDHARFDALRRALNMPLNGWVN